MIPKKLLIVILAISFSGYMLAQFTGDGFKQTVVSSPHDLRSASTGGTAVCEYCHVPHKTGNETYPLLWNVTVKTGPYAFYGGSATFEGAATIRDPASASSTNKAAYMSLLCLSCHDGSITLASFYNNVDNILGTALAATPPNIGEAGKLGNDHPVDFTYSVALATADGGLQSPTEGVGVAIPYVGKTTPFPLFKDQSADPSGRMECATCHNPHNNTINNFLRMANSSSALCLNCHGN